MRSPLPLRTRAFHLACWLFGVPLPDEHPRVMRNADWDVVARIAAAFLFALVAGLVISVVSENVRDFMLGWNAGYPVSPRSDATPFDITKDWKLPTSVLFALLALTWAIVHSQVLKRAVALSIRRHEEERERANRQEIASTLRLLQAQIEPHFLFNTLGSVQHLAEGKAPEAAALTADLIVFLRATIGNLRAASTTLADDFAICEAYLHIMQTRLRQRLSYQIDCPPSLRDFPLPTALLLTLLENAVKHGIEPSPEGGRITVSARRDEEGNVIISVADTGAGFGDEIGQGLGLQNIRDRLALAYQGKASLELEENAPRGVAAHLKLPGTQ